LIKDGRIDRIDENEMCSVSHAVYVVELQGRIKYDGRTREKIGSPDAARYIGFEVWL